MYTQLFGTDGIRGKHGEFPLDEATLERLGAAVARSASRLISARDPSRRCVLFGRDTRSSGASIFQLISRPLAAQGYPVRDLGVVPTPALSYLVPSYGAALGCVISASHNPPEYNGLKFFGPNGQKISEEWEMEIEDQVLKRDFRLKKMGIFKNPASSIQHPASAQAARQRYVDFLRCQVPVNMDFRGLRIAVDCAHGANGAVLPTLLESLGASVAVRGNKPNGRNINTKAGAMDPCGLQKLVKSFSADVGFAFDGDADRLVVVDEKGRVVPGEWILATMALIRRQEGEPGAEALVTTQVSNFGLKHFLQARGISVLETRVGDRWVLESLQKEGLGFGGENSGHYIWPFILPSADGSLAAILTAQAMVRSGRPVSRMLAKFSLMPQVTLQVPAPKEKPSLDSLPDFLSELGRVADALDHRGRVLVRYSGTEPILRILLEAEISKAKLAAMADSLRKAYGKAIE
ncbi:MAG: phosphoglucosamine mutase [Elusimicrobia bacterium]|nr:phosphoglucosamine mutase [Elusimicrobiota bacterium]